MANSTHTIYIRTWRGRYVFFNGIAYLMKVYAFVQVGVPSCSDDLTHRSSANFKCEVADVNNGIPIDFRAINAFRWNLVNHVVLNFSWYIQFNWFVQQIFQQAPSACCLQHLTDTCHCFFYHSRQPVALKWDGGSLGLVSTVFCRKIFDLKFDIFFSFY